MVTETLPETAVQADPEPQKVETEAPETEQVEEGAAPETEAAAADQIKVTEEKPDYITRAELEKRDAEVAQRAAADALESDRRRRQTENARRAAQEKRDIEDRAELIDSMKASLGAKGIYELPDEAVINSVDRMVRKRTEQIASSQMDTVDAAWDYLTAPAYGKSVDLEEHAETAAKRLGPKVQHLIDTIRPAIEAKAREGYIAEADLPQHVEAEIAKRAAKSREGKTEIRRVEQAAPASGVMSWAAYMNLSVDERAALPDTERQAIMAADRKARLGG